MNPEYRYHYNYVIKLNQRWLARIRSWPVGYLREVNRPALRINTLRELGRVRAQMRKIHAL